VVAKALEIRADLGRVLTPEKPANWVSLMSVGVSCKKHLISTCRERCISEEEKKQKVEQETGSSKAAHCPNS
jgi:hypothetical protein